MITKDEMKTLKTFGYIMTPDIQKLKRYEKESKLICAANTEEHKNMFNAHYTYFLKTNIKVLQNDY